MTGERPAAMRSAFTKRGNPASAGRNSRANVVLPAPFGPAMMTTFFSALIPRSHRSSGAAWIRCGDRRDDLDCTQLEGTCDEIAAGSLGGVHGLIRAAEQGVEVIVAGLGQCEPHGDVQARGTALDHALRSLDGPPQPFRDHARGGLID